MKAKPFIKWVGGKTQLIEQLEVLLPADFDKWENVTYIEPFVGGGAMLFYMLQAHPNITKAVINDINADLTTCYTVVRDTPDTLIKELDIIQKEYYSLSDSDARQVYYLKMREEYNTKRVSPVRNTALFFFLNRTCFNGLYRVNKKGLFNVPFGKQDRPMICDPVTIYADSELLKRVTICTGDYQQTIDEAEGNTFFYFDPPYRPLNATSSFNDYAKEAFNDDAQKRLRDFCEQVNKRGFLFMQSNSDCSGANPEDTFFEDLYLSNPAFEMQRVFASRNINSVASKRGKLTEIVVRNYKTPKAQQTLTLFD